MKRVLIVVSALLLALAIVSCGNLAVDKKDGTGSIVINLGGSAARLATAHFDGGVDGTVKIHTLEDVTDWQLYLRTPENEIGYANKVKAASTIQFDDIPEGDYYVILNALIGDTWIGQGTSGINQDTGDRIMVTVKEKAVTETELELTLMKCIYYFNTPTLNDLLGTESISTNPDGTLHIALNTDISDYSGINILAPAGKEFDYWTLVGDTSGTHYRAFNPNQSNPDDTSSSVSLNGKTLPLEFVPVWKDATGGSNNNSSGGGRTLDTDIGKFIKLDACTVNESVGAGTFSNATNEPVEVSSFYIADTELTYENWYEVFKWATANERGDSKYTFNSSGGQGNNEPQNKDATTQEPVTNIFWRDAVVWCNAASEKEGLQPVYYYFAEGDPTDFSDTTKILRYADGYSSNGNLYPHPESVANGSGKAENATINPNANGYRLPYEVEWEFAARGGDPTSEAWNYTYSGVTGDDSTELARYIVGKKVNSNVTSTADVKSTGNANSAGLYDMSGNVYEYCWDKVENSTIRVVRGGAWNCVSMEYYQVDVRDYQGGFQPSGYSSHYGFRVVKNIPAGN